MLAAYLDLTTWPAAPSSTLKPGALKAEKRKPSESAGSRAALHPWLKVGATLKVSATLNLLNLAENRQKTGPFRGHVKDYLN